MAPLGVVSHCEEKLLACIRYLFPIPGVVGKKVGSVDTNPVPKCGNVHSNQGYIEARGL